MKTLIITSLVYSVLMLNINAQPTINQLTTSQYNAVKFNGVLKTSIESTEANLNLMSSLFGAPNSIQNVGEDIGEHCREFNYSTGLSVYFEGLSNNDIRVGEINATSITVKGITVSIGDNISVLGNNILLNNCTDGDKSIIFTHLDADGHSIVINFNEVTKRVTKITYYLWT